MRCLRCFLITERPCQGVIISKGARMPHTSWSGVVACLCSQRCCGHHPISQPPTCGRAAAVSAGRCSWLGNASHMAQRSRQWDLRLPKGKTWESSALAGSCTRVSLMGWPPGPGYVTMKPAHPLHLCVARVTWCPELGFYLF